MYEAEARPASAAGHKNHVYRCLSDSLDWQAPNGRQGSFAPGACRRPVRRMGFTRREDKNILGRNMKEVPSWRYRPGKSATRNMNGQVVEKPEAFPGEVVRRYEIQRQLVSLFLGREQLLNGCEAKGGSATDGGLAPYSSWRGARGVEVDRRPQVGICNTVLWLKAIFNLVSDRKEIPVQPALINVSTAVF